MLMAAASRPRGELAEAAGLRLEDGRVVDDEHMRTCADGVLAAGDVAFARNAAAGRPLRRRALGRGARPWARPPGARPRARTRVWDAAPGFWSTIGDQTLKHAAWGDGYDDARFVEHPGGAFTVWYGAAARSVGVLAHERDEDYERGRELVEQGAAAVRSAAAARSGARACVVVPARDEEALVGALHRARSPRSAAWRARRSRSCSCSTAAATRPRRAPARRGAAGSRCTCSRAPAPGVGARPRATGWTSRASGCSPSGAPTG